MADWSPLSHSWDDVIPVEVITDIQLPFLKMFWSYEDPETILTTVRFCSGILGKSRCEWIHRVAWRISLISTVIRILKEKAPNSNDYQAYIFPLHCYYHQRKFIFKQSNQQTWSTSASPQESRLHWWPLLLVGRNVWSHCLLALKVSWNVPLRPE